MLPRRWRLPREDRTQHGVDASFKRPLGREQLVQDHAEAVLVGCAGQLVGITSTCSFDMYAGEPIRVPRWVILVEFC